MLTGLGLEVGDTLKWFGLDPMLVLDAHHKGSELQGETFAIARSAV